MAVSAFILAGEASGDRLAAQLMDAGSDIFTAISWFGVGGPQMQARQLDSLAAVSYTHLRAHETLR